MSTTIAILSYSNTRLLSRLGISPRYATLQFRSSPTKTQSFSPISSDNFQAFSGKKLFFESRFRVCVGAKDDGVDEAEKEARGESTMPERFRYLTKEAPDPPQRWPWFVAAAAFLLYGWRAVLFELYNWKRAAFGIVGFVGYLSKLVLALALFFHFLGDPISTLIQCTETILYSIRAFFFGIVAYAPVPKLTTLTMLVLAILVVAEATVLNLVNIQPYFLTISSLIGYDVVQGFVSKHFLWNLLVGLYGFSQFVKKRDHVSFALLVAAVLIGVGEQWIRVLMMTSYLALAIFHHLKTHSIGNDEVAVIDMKASLSLLGVALAIGIRVAAKWAGYWHLTWMIA